MKTSWRIELPQLLVIAAMFALAAWAWPQVPERIPIHWNFRGEIDGWGGRGIGLLGLPLTTVGLYLLMWVVPFIDPGKCNYENFARAYGIIRLMFVMFMAVIYAVPVRAAFGHAIDMKTVILLALGALFIVLGNFMGKLRPNWFVGVRTPWTLSSRLSWDKTHCLTGWLFALMGVAAFAVAAHPTMWMFVAMLVIDGLCIVWSIVYSYLVYRTDPHRTSPAGTSPTSEANAA